jgi:hypothetical protein
MRTGKGARGEVVNRFSGGNGPGIRPVGHLSFWPFDLVHARLE